MSLCMFTRLLLFETEVDDFDFLDSFEEQRYSLLQFTLKSGELRSEPVWWGIDNPPNLGKVTILGVKSQVTEVTINQVSQNFMYDSARKVSIVCSSHHDEVVLETDSKYCGCVWKNTCVSGDRL